MPYISQDQRERITNQTSFPPIGNSGQLNYLICKLVLHYLEGRGDYRYQDLNDVLGALEGAKQEVYARIVRPYEDKKIKEHGDIF